MDVPSLFLISGALVVIGVCLFMLMELKARTLRTQVIDVPGTLRFEAHTFSVEVLLPTQQIKVDADQGRLTRHPLQGGPDEVQEGPLDATLPAPGLTIAVMKAETTLRPRQGRPQATGLYSITVRASDAMINAGKKLPGGFETVLEVTHIPGPVAQSFENFSNRVQIWADKLERRLKRELEERAQHEAAAALAEHEAKVRAEKAAERGKQKSGSNNGGPPP